MVLCLLLAPGSAVEVVTDSQIVCDGLVKGPKGGIGGDLAACWAALWRTVAERGLDVRALKVKSHGVDDFDLYKKYHIDPTHMLGNAVADQLAERGSFEHGLSISEPQVTDAMSQLALCESIQQRLVDILLHLVLVNPRSAVRDRVVKERLPEVRGYPMTYFLMHSQHQVVVTKKGVHCLRCLQGYPLPDEPGKRAFLVSPCSGVAAGGGCGWLGLPSSIAN